MRLADGQLAAGEQPHNHALLFVAADGLDLLDDDDDAALDLSEEIGAEVVK